MPHNTIMAGRPSRTSVIKALAALRTNKHVKSLDVYGEPRQMLAVDEIANCFSIGRRSVLDRCSKLQILIVRSEDVDYVSVDDIEKRWIPLTTAPGIEVQPMCPVTGLLQSSEARCDQIERILDKALKLRTSE